MNLLEDAVSRAKDQLMSVENELSSMDSKQATKRDEVVKCENELKESKERVGEAEAEMKSLTEKEAMLAKKSTELLVRCYEWMW